MTLHAQSQSVLPSGRDPLSLLPLLYRTGFTGWCSARAPGLESKLFVRKGQIVHAELPDHTDSLGHVLYDLGMLDLETYRETMRQAKVEGRKHGQILTELKIIDELRLSHALSVQLGRKLRRILGTSGLRVAPTVGTHEHGADDRLRRILPHPRQVMYLCARLSRPEAIADALAPLRDQRVFIPLDRRALLQRYGLGEQATSVAMRLLVAPLRLAELPQTPDVLAALAVLHLTEVLQRESGSARDPKPLRQTREVPPDETVAEDFTTATPLTMTGPAPQRTAEALVTAAQLRSRLDHIDKQSLFETLGLHRTVDPEGIGATYAALRRRFHPQRIAALGLDELVVDADRLCARLDEARAILGDTPSRVRYEALLDQKIPPPRAALLLAAERAFQRGDQLLERGDFVGALEALETAVRSNDAEAAYVATLAWARYLGALERGEDLHKTSTQASQHLLRTIQRWPSCMRALLFLSRVLAGEGDFDRAKGALRRALRLAPADVELLRELRWCERRITQPRTRFLGRR